VLITRGVGSPPAPRRCPPTPGGALPTLARDRRRERTPPRTPCHRYRYEPLGLGPRATSPAHRAVTSARRAAPSACPHHYQWDRHRESGRQPARSPRAPASGPRAQPGARSRTRTRRVVSCRVAPFQGTLHRLRERSVASHEHRRPDGKAGAWQSGIDHCILKSTCSRGLSSP